MGEKFDQVAQLYNLEASVRRNDFDHFKLSLEQSTKQNVLNICRDSFSDFSRVEQSFRPFFNQECLSQAFDSKADNEMIIELRDSKVNRSELDAFKDVIMNLNKKIKQIAAVQNSQANAINKHKKNESLSRNSKIVSNWINSTDPDFKKPCKNSIVLNMTQLDDSVFN